MSRTRRPHADQRVIRGMDRDRLWSRLPDRSGDPLEAADGCVCCGGTGVDLTADPPCRCRPCLGTGWAS